LLQRKIISVRLPSDRDQKMAAHQRVLAVVAADNDTDLRVHRVDARDCDVAAQRDPLPRKRIEHDGSAFGVFARERLRRVEHRDRATEAAKGLGELEADRPGADDDEVLRRHGEVEHRLIGEIGHGIQARDRRNRRRRARRDDETPRLDLDAVARHHGRAILEAGGTLDHAHAEAAKPLLRVVRCDRGDDVVHASVDSTEIDLGRCGRDAEGTRPCDGMSTRRAGEQGFRRHAAGIEAFAPELSLLHQHHGYAERGGGGGDREPA
jgi:hypothetical protein